jgi:ferredoxin
MTMISYLARQDLGIKICGSAAAESIIEGITRRNRKEEVSQMVRIGSNSCIANILISLLFCGDCISLCITLHLIEADE